MALALALFLGHGIASGTPQAGSEEVHGTVVDVETGLGLRDVRVYFEAFDEVLAETRSDDEGRFRLTQADPPRRRLEVEPPEGWSLTVARVRLSPEQRTGAEPIRIELQRRSQRPVEGRLIDRVTGRPIPHFWIELRPAAGDPEVLQSDDEGRFRSTGSYPRGPITLDAARTRGRRLLGQRPLVWAHLDPTGDPFVEWELDPGPRFELSLGTEFLGADPSGLRATWIESSGRPAAEGIDAWIAEDSPVSSAVVIERNRAWVRLNPRSLGARPPRGLRVYTRDLLQASDIEFGRGGVRAASAIDAPPFEVKLLPLGLMSGRLEGRDQAALPGALVQWEEIPVGNALVGPDSFGRGVVTDAEGRFVVPFLTPGLYAWRFSAENHEPTQVELPIDAAVESSVNFRLSAIPMAGALEGSLRSRTGTYAPDLRIHARHLAGKHPSRFAPVLWGGTPDDRVGRFRFEDLPEGPWQLGFNGIHGFEITPTVRTVTPPSTDVDFEILDDVPSARLTIELIDGTDGSPCMGPHQLREISPNGAQARSFHRGARIELGRRPLAADSRFALESSGYAPGSLGIEDFVVPPEGDPENRTNGGEAHRIARLELLRGWATTFRVLTEAGHAAEGARLFLDDRDIGVCDAKGEVSVHWPAATDPPTRFLIRYRDLEHAPPAGFRSDELPPPRNDDPTVTEVRLRPKNRPGNNSDSVGR